MQTLQLHNLQFLCCQIGRIVYLVITISIWDVHFCYVQHFLIDGALFIGRSL